MHAPSLAQIEQMTLKAVADLPAGFRALLDDVVFRVADFPDKQTLHALGLKSPFDLLGLYHGRSIAHTAFTGDMPNTIWLYRRPLLEYWVVTGEPLQNLVTHVLVHEVGHHMGLSDDDIARIEAESDDN